MVALFQRERTVIGKHIRNIFAEGELQEEVVCANFAHTTQHGAIEGKTQTSSVQLYNLDVIISVGYRVKSQRGTQFRIWANKVLKDYIVKGYAVNNKLKLKQYEDLKQTVMLLSNVIQNKVLTNDSSYVALSRYKKSFVQRWQQADCGIPFPVVFRKERHLIQTQRIAVDRK